MVGGEMQFNNDVDVQKLTDAVDMAFHKVPQTPEDIHTRVCRIVRDSMPKETDEEFVEHVAKLVEECRRERLEARGRARISEIRQCSTRLLGRIPRRFDIRERQAGEEAEDRRDTVADEFRKSQVVA